MNRGKGHYKSQIRGAQDALSLVGTKLLDWAPLQVGFYFTCSGPICYALALFPCVDRDRCPHCSVPNFCFMEHVYCGLPGILSKELNALPMTSLLVQLCKYGLFFRLCCQGTSYSEGDWESLCKVQSDGHDLCFLCE
jgi:hypothetical protein